MAEGLLPVLLQESPDVVEVQFPVLRAEKAVAGAEKEVELEFPAGGVQRRDGPGGVFGLYETVVGAVEDQEFPGILDDLLIDVKPVLEEALVILPADLQAHQRVILRDFLVGLVQGQDIVVDAEGRVHEDSRIDLVRHIRGGDSGDASSLALSQEEYIVLVDLIPSRDHVHDVDEVLPFGDDGHLLGASFAPAPEAAAGEVIAVADVPFLGELGDHRIEADVASVVSVREDDGRMLAGRLGEERLPVELPSCTHAGNLLHLKGFVRRRFPHSPPGGLGCCAKHHGQSGEYDEKSFHSA